MKTFTQIKVCLAVATMALALVAVAAEKEDKKEEKVKLGDCPAVVQQTIKDSAGGGEIVEIEKTTQKDGTVVYEAEFKKTDGKKAEVKIAADGKLIKKEDADEDDDDEEEDDDKD